MFFLAGLINQAHTTVSLRNLFSARAALRSASLATVSDESTSSESASSSSVMCTLSASGNGFC